VDDERGAVAVEDRERSGAQRHPLGEGFEPSGPVRLDRDVGQIAGVRAGGIQDSMLAASSSHWPTLPSEPPATPTVSLRSR
jgi:hypothetical protein